MVPKKAPTVELNLLPTGGTIMTTPYEDLSALISLPIGTRIILMSGTGKSRVYEVQREGKTTVTVLDLKRNAITCFQKTMLFACYRDGLAMFVPPRKSSRPAFAA
jgi:hypothetical protein